ncbi:MAG TPA: cysteine peptidase family C39 domain-containing protein [Ignavibacteriales bacterium]|nr:cysteine peptidase family C39 domain-containing protein [Ignavibacteriales bacterium]
MSFYPQPNKYYCGPFALKYALVMLGIFKNENSIAKSAGSTWWAGTDEIGLARAAKKFHCHMHYFRSEDPAIALDLLDRELKKGLPCILSVNNWGHWLTVLGYQKERYIIVDSGLERVIAIMTPKQLLRKWKYVDEEGCPSYDGYSLLPQFKVATKALFTLEKARHVMYKKNENLAKKWDTYFNDLINICRPRTPNSYNIISVNEFLRRHRNPLIKKVAFWHGTPNYKELEKILQNFQFVAEVYDLVIYHEDEKRALIDFTSLLMMYACGKYGMDAIY